MFRFGREMASGIDAHGTVGASQVTFGHSTGEAHLNVVHLERGGVLGAHEAPTPQLFIVVEGQGWVTAGDGRRRTVGVGDAVFWDQGEMRGSGSDSGMTAVIMQALELNIVAPLTASRPSATPGGIAQVFPTKNSARSADTGELLPVARSSEALKNRSSYPPSSAERNGERQWARHVW